MNKRLRLCLFVSISVSSINLQAEVTAVSEHGFISEHVLILNATPQQAYVALTREISQWWDASHSYSGAAKNFSLDPRAGGCFCEQLANGSVEHLRVVYAEAGRQLRLEGGLGPLQGIAVSGSMTFNFADHEQGTELRYRYVVGGYAPDGLAAWAEPVDRVQLGQLKRLQQHLQ